VGQIDKRKTDQSGMKSLTYINSQTVTSLVMKSPPFEKPYSKVSTVSYNIKRLNVALEKCNVGLKSTDLRLMVGWLGMVTAPTRSEGNLGYMHQPPIDRTGTVDEPFNFDSSPFQMPVLTASKLKFSDACQMQVEAILNNAQKYGGNKIIVTWSGGVDSTCVLAAFILHLGEVEAARRIIVCMNDYSIAEHPKFYQDYILRCGFEVISSDGYYETFPKTYANHVIVNGDPGGALDGGSALRLLVMKKDNILGADWKDQIRSIYPEVFNIRALDNVLSDDRLFEHFLNAIETSAASANFEIKNAFDCMWWYYLNFKWQAMSLNFHKTCGTLFAQNLRSQATWNEMFVPFFASEAFQLWSYSSREVIAKSKMSEQWPKHYKKAFKELIYSLDKDQAYRDGKAKDAALYKINAASVKAFAMDSDYKPLFLRSSYDGVLK